jgi:hypothetical protein
LACAGGIISGLTSFGASAQIPPVGGGDVDSDDDPNEVDDGLPDDILDPEDIVATAQAGRALAPIATVVPVLPTPFPAGLLAPQPVQQQPLPPSPVGPQVLPPVSIPPGATCEEVLVPAERRVGPIVIEVRATGAAEVPPVDTIGSAFARFTLDEASGRLDYYVTAFGFSPGLVTGAHIHRGAPGVNGPIVHFISATGFVQANGSLQLSAADISDLQAGNLYFNVHSVDNPGGFARAQLVVQPQPAQRQLVCQEPAPAPRPGQAQAAATTPLGRIAPPNTGDGGLLVAD